MKSEEGVRRVNHQKKHSNLESNYDIFFFFCSRREYVGRNNGGTENECEKDE